VTQKKILALLIKYLNYAKKKKIQIGQSPFCDFITWTECLGNEHLKLIYKKKFLSIKLLL
jgi:hypothetical protein